MNKQTKQQQQNFAKKVEKKVENFTKIIWSGRHGPVQLWMVSIRGCQQNNESEKAFVRTKEYVWQKNEDYMGGATCWSFRNWVWDFIQQVFYFFYQQRVP